MCTYVVRGFKKVGTVELDNKLIYIIIKLFGYLIIIYPHKVMYLSFSQVDTYFQKSYLDFKTGSIKNISTITPYSYINVSWYL